MESTTDHTDRFDREVEKLSDMPFSRTIEEGLGRTPQQLATAATVNADSLRLAWYGVQHAFGKAAKPEHAFQLLELNLRTLEKMPTGEPAPKAPPLPKLFEPPSNLRMSGTTSI